MQVSFAIKSRFEGIRDDAITNNRDSASRALPDRKTRIFNAKVLLMYWCNAESTIFTRTEIY